MARFDQPIEPMTLGNMRELGVRSLDVLVCQIATPWRLAGGSGVKVPAIGIAEPRHYRQTQPVDGPQFPWNSAPVVPYGKGSVNGTPGGAKCPTTKSQQSISIDRAWSVTA
jgi:hypothetical protein